MAITVAELAIILGADTGLAEEKLAKVAEFLGPGGPLILASVAAAAGIGVASAKMAADFQQGVTRLRTGAGDATDSFASLEAGILKVSVATGVNADQLVQASYLILSSGQRGQQAMDTLTAAAKGAQIEQASVVDVANVVSGVMTNYGTKVYGATQYMNGLIKAVSSGKITLQDLSVAMGPIDPIAQHLGISFADTAAAMTTQTNAMIPAARAATGLRFMYMALENPTKKANDAMKKLGLDSVAVGNEMKVSLPLALQMITNAALKVGPEGSVPFNRAVGDMVGGIRGLSAFLALTGTHMSAFVANSAAITAAMKAGKGEVTGWALAQAGFNIQMDQAKAAVGALMIQLGTHLLPVLTQLVGVFINQVIPAVSAVASRLGDFFGFLQTHEVAMAAFKGALIAIAVVISGVLVGAFIAWAVAAGAAAVATVVAMAPILLIVGAIAAVIAILILAVNHWGQITDALGRFKDMLGNVLGAIGDFVGGVLGWFGHLFQSLVGGSIIPELTTAIVVLFARMAVASLALVAGWVVNLIGTVARMAGEFLNRMQTMEAQAIVSIVVFVANAAGRFAQLPGRALAALGGLAVQLGGFFANLALQAIGWGEHLVSGLAQGIRNMAGQVIGAAGNIAGAIGSMLHMSHPERGPLADVESWMPHFGQLLASGLRAQVPVVGAAATQVAGALAAPVSGTGGGGGGTVHNWTVNNYGQDPHAVVSALRREVRLRRV